MNKIVDRFPTECEISFPELQESLRAFHGIALIHAIRQIGAPFVGPCGAKGRCGKCRVKVTGDLNEPQPNERAVLSKEEIASGLRLACSAIAQGDVSVSFVSTPSIELPMVGGQHQALDGRLAPLVSAVDIRVSPAKTSDPRPDTTRVIEEMKHQTGKVWKVSDPSAVGQLSRVLREENWAVTGFQNGREFIGFAPLGSRPIGAAIDLGSTRISAQLWDLADRVPIAGQARLNPQTSFGADIMTRLQHALQTEGQGDLSRVVRQSLKEMLLDMGRSTGILQDQIVDLCLAGNTAMTHLLLGLPVRQLASAPYVPSTVDPLDILARDLGFSTAPAARLYILPGIGGFVGSDHVAMIIGSDLDTSPVLTLGIDIGTNTELVLTGPELSRPLCTSCPSGPVFEGMHISCGVSAVSGAIFEMAYTDGEVIYSTIADRPPVGICGTGMVDAIAVMRRQRIIDHRGKFTDGPNQDRTGKSGPQFIVAPASSGACGRPVSITQKDVREILLAKGAIAAAIRILLDKAEVSEDQVKRVVIAGSFGGKLDVDNARHIGMFPKFNEAEFEQVRNGALAGVTATLLSRRNRERAKQIQKSAIHLSLVSHPDFALRLAESINLPF